MGPVEPDATYTCGPHCKSERDLRDRLQDLTNLTFQDNRDEWFRFAEELELDLVFVDHLCDVVHEGKWRDEAKVKKFLKREARKRGLEQDAIERELYPEAEAPSFHRFAGEPQAAKRLRVPVSRLSRSLGTGTCRGKM